MRRALWLTAAFAVVGALAISQQVPDRTLQCVSQVGDNMYRSKDRWVIWTEHCSRKPDCESASLRYRRNEKPRVYWSDGTYCWVINVAPPTR